MKSWTPAVTGLVAAIVLATIAGIVLSGLTPGPGESAPILLKSMSPGTQAAAHLRLSHPALPVECRPAAWVHLSLSGRCPISQGAAEGAARAALPRSRAILPIGAAVTSSVKDAAPAVAEGQSQVKESVLAWVDLPAGGIMGGPPQPMHGMVWVIAADQSVNAGIGCPPIVGMATLRLRCGGAARYLVFVDGLTGKVRLVTFRP